MNTADYTVRVNDHQTVTMTVHEGKVQVIINEGIPQVYATSPARLRDWARALNAVAGILEETQQEGKTP